MMYILTFALGYLLANWLMVSSQFEKQHNLLRKLVFVVTISIMNVYFYIKHTGDK